jgi:hypothetical protein
LLLGWPTQRDSDASLEGGEDATVEVGKNLANITLRNHSEKVEDLAYTPAQTKESYGHLSII